jgi:hypothetical protein
MVTSTLPGSTSSYRVRVQADLAKQFIGTDPMQFLKSYNVDAIGQLQSIFEGVTLNKIILRRNRLNLRSPFYNNIASATIKSADEETAPIADSVTP